MIAERDRPLTVAAWLTSVLDGGQVVGLGSQGHARTGGSGHPGLGSVQVIELHWSRRSAPGGRLTAHADERELPLACLCVGRNSHASDTARRDGIVVDQSLGQIADYALHVDNEVRRNQQCITTSSARPERRMAGLE